ncbi:Occludin homology domain [Dillenia turbinata]|uniref:Occludin homology domain n=1 Tax=Dillenia turbinata TaxID=194707 RepID=A0AAN8YTC4_9MAGN
MFGGAGKLGRGGARGGVTNHSRTSFPPPPPLRPSSGGGRLSTPGGPNSRNRNPSSSFSSSSARPSTIDETFSLVPGNNPPEFGMIIRLAPTLIDEIKKIEAQGGTARIKFDSNAVNLSGNVDVGGRDFSFAWSHESSDLCDIYEERQSGENGNGLLVEHGCSWRKLNVHRILDESTKNRVKKRSEEAERLLKSRKAIVLDPGNPSMKNQTKAFAAAEASAAWKPYNKKDPPFKKWKVEPPQGPPKVIQKSKMPSTSTAKGRNSLSPLPSPHEVSGALASPSEAGNFSNIRGRAQEAIPIQVTSKDKAGNMGRDIPSRNTIEPAREKGGYHLPPDQGSLKLCNSASVLESSPEDNKCHKPASEENYDQTPAPNKSVVGRCLTSKPEEQAQLTSKAMEEEKSLDKVDILQNSPDLVGDRKVSDNSEGQAGSSSDSGSDSDSESDSSDSGSRSRSRSKSRSPARGGSGSSSDSDSDASSSSKEESDVDVDIMTSDGEKELINKLQTSDHEFPTSSELPIQNGIDEKQGSPGPEAVDIDKDSPSDDKETDMAVSTNLCRNMECEKPSEEAKTLPSDHDGHPEHHISARKVFSDRGNIVKVGSRPDQSDNLDRTYRGTNKRGSEFMNFDEKTEHAKRVKAGSFPQTQGSWGHDSRAIESSHYVSPYRHNEDASKGPALHMTERSSRGGIGDFGSRNGYNQAIPGKSVSDSQQMGRRSSDHAGWTKAADTVERPAKHGESSTHSAKQFERAFQVNEDFHVHKEKFYEEPQDDDASVDKKKLPRHLKESGIGDKHAMPTESQYRKPGEPPGKCQEGVAVSNSQKGSLQKDNTRSDVERSPIVNGRGNIIRRELSDLESGELCEALPEETLGVKKRFERKGSFSQSENKTSPSDNWNSDLSKAKPPGKAVGNRKPSPPISRVGNSSNLEVLSKKMTPEPHVEDLGRPQPWAVQSQLQQPLRLDHVEVGGQHGKFGDAGRKSRKNETADAQGVDVEGYGETHQKSHAAVSQQLDHRRGQVPQPMKENKIQKSVPVADFSDKRKDALLSDSNKSGQNKRESSSEENSCPYSKYEKKEPELKAPIEDFSRYKEYVEEYRDKYESYCSLNKVLENYRVEFQKLGRDLEMAKVRDLEQYHILLGQLKETYQQCGPRHKRLKKIFIVLHEELKVVNTLTPQAKDQRFCTKSYKRLKFCVSNFNWDAPLRSPSCGGCLAIILRFNGGSEMQCRWM